MKHKNQFLTTLLIAKEYRYQKTKQLVFDHHCQYLTVSLNIPGMKKTNQIIETFFDNIVLKNIINFLSSNEIKFQLLWQTNDVAGNFALFALFIKQPFLKPLKIAFINYEQSASFWQLVDIDLYTEQHVKISRAECGYLPRKCYLCYGSAKECAIKQKHNYEALWKHCLDLIKTI